MPHPQPPPLLPPQHRQLITVDRKYSLMNKQVKMQVEHHLQTQLNYLLGRKQLDLMRKKKVKQIQEAFEQQRISRLAKMEERTARSQKIQAQTLREKQGRSRRNIELIESRIKKQAEVNESQIEKMLEAQQEYEKRASISRASSKSLVRSTGNLSNNFNHNLLKTQMQQSLDSIDSKIDFIESRIEQAKTNQQFYQTQKSQRAKSFYKNVDETLGKIDSNFHKKQGRNIQEYYLRITHILHCQQKSKSLIQQQSEKRTKEINQKFKKCNENLKYINSQRQTRLQQIQDKLDNQSRAPKTQRTRKNPFYQELLAANQKSIQQKQALKAESIVAKHLNLTLKNRVMRQKKEKMFQSLTRDPNK